LENFRIQAAQQVEINIMSSLQNLKPMRKISASLAAERSTVDLAGAAAGPMKVGTVNVFGRSLHLAAANKTGSSFVPAPLGKER